MRFGKLLTAVAASSLIAAPALANPAATLSLAKVSGVKASTSAGKSNKQASPHISPFLIIGGIAGGAGLIAYAVSQNNHDNSPDSP